jgi:hypothetical protein
MYVYQTVDSPEVSQDCSTRTQRALSLPGEILGLWKRQLKIVA